MSELREISHTKNALLQDIKGRIKAAASCAMIDGPSFAYMRHRAGFDRRTAAAYLDVSLRTLRRYEVEGAPRMAVLALAARAGEMEGWEGFFFHPGEVHTRLGDVVSCTEVEQRDYLYYLYWMRGWEARKRDEPMPSPQRPALTLHEFA